MLILLDIILPVFLVIAAGYIAVWRDWFSASGVDMLMRFTQNFAIPCLLFNAIVKLDLHAVFQGGLLASFYGGALTCFAIAIALARWVFKLRPGEAVAFGFCALFSNTVLLGLPIMERAFGSAALAANYAIIAVHAPICYLVGITCMEIARADGKGAADTLHRVLKAMFSNILAVALLLGLLVNVMQLWLPQAVLSASQMVARAALPAALFALGGVLVRYQIKAQLPKVAVVCGLSLIVHPSIVYLLASHVFMLSDAMLRSAVVTAAMAPGINVYVFANMYHRAEELASSTVLIGTALSIISVAAWLAFLGVAS